MKYVKMTIEDALRYSNGNKSTTVLVAVQDLEKDESPEFIKRSKADCETIIKEAETIARVYDEFVNQLRVFTEEQSDIKSISPRGKLSTILFKE